ncbi:MAG: branched-chain amino acid ABC transporter permease [Thermodesulfobacteriota bacterium]
MKSFLRFIFALLLMFFLILAPWLFEKDYYIHLLVMACIYSMLAQSLGLIVGFTGQVSLCHATFYGIGAYISALLSLNYEMSFWVTFWFGGIGAALAAYIFGSIVLRLKGHFLAITTALFGIMVTLVLDNWVELTKGPMGLPGIPNPTPINILGFKIGFSSRTEYYYLALTFVFFMSTILYRIIHSRIGKAMLAIRENEEVAQSVGIDTMRFKLAAFTVGSGFAGIAGSFYAHYILFISPVSFTLSESINILVMMIFGGMQTFVGPIIGAITLTILPEFLRMTGALRLTLYGLVLILLIIFLPSGIVGSIKEKWSSSNEGK